METAPLTPRRRVRRLAATWAILLTTAALCAGAWAIGKAGERALFAPVAAGPAPLPLPPRAGHPALGRAPITSVRTGAGTVVWVFGDSICSGQGLPAAQAWPARLATRANVTMVNWCRPGYAYSGYLGNVSDELTAAYASGQPVPPTVIVAAGSNDLGIHDSDTILATEYAALAVHDSLIQHGAGRVLFAAVIPRGDGHEALRQQFNMWMAIAFGTDYAQIDYFYNPVNAALFARDYQADKLHPNATGAQLLADTFDLGTLPGKRTLRRH